MISISDLKFFKKTEYSKNGMNYSLSLIFLGTLLVCFVSLVPKLSKGLDYSLIVESSELKYQNPIICNTYNERSTSTFGDNEFSYSTASLMDMAFFEDIFSTINRLVQADTVKQLETDEYIKSLEKDKFKGGRTARWYYGWIIFKDYAWYKKLFGGGFDYLEMFGKKFGEAKYDWPHNPMISAFLYSGILGGLAFIWFMIMVIVNYLLYLKRHLFFFVCFVVTFFFVFFSDTSLFNTPLFTFLCLVPFFTKYLYLKEKYNDSQKIPFKKILFW
jgi:hypothetical protein